MGESLPNPLSFAEDAETRNAALNPFLIQLPSLLEASVPAGICQQMHVNEAKRETYPSEVSRWSSKQKRGMSQFDATC